MDIAFSDSFQSVPVKQEEISAEDFFPSKKSLRRKCISTADKTRLQQTLVDIRNGGRSGPGRVG